VICPVCAAENTDNEALCDGCGFLLAEGGGGRPADPPADATAVAPEQVSATCPACGADIPDPANLVCVECLEPLTPLSADPAIAHTPSLRLLFAGQPVEVSSTTSVVLGRDPELSPVATLLATHDNVSRRHAVVGIGSDGKAWVRDENSTNGTFVNNTPVPGGHTAPLSHGDQLRIASDVIAHVELRSGAPA
jgi:hypothetical protein